ncbi:hypothetical protein C0995_016009 [Termitomyces sp. Mi166|nr:hypothetical protein C0995_016009 [Termitomyces sp. Mi166\
MARRIYCVRDCFQDIVINTRKRPAAENYCRIRSLAALCSIVIGENIENHCQVVNEDDDEGVKEEDENDFFNLMDDLYDAIPAEYRRCALLSHALRLILSHCDDNATLLTRLLDVALDHKLDFEANLLLHGLVSLSLSSPSGTSRSPLICHPAHANFFLDLYTQWNSSGSSNATFFRILITALEASQDNSALSSKAVHSVAQIMYVQDFTSYLRLISVSSTFAAEHCTASIAFEPEARRSLLYRISIWLKVILERLPSATQYEPCGKAKAYSNELGEMLTYVLSLVCSLNALQVPEGLEADIQDIILSLSTQWLTVRRFPLQNLVERLSVTLPRVSTFTPLVAKVYVDSDGCLHAFRTAIQDMASTLYTFDLLHLHASLLGCTLCYIEHPPHERDLAIKNSVPEIQKYRHELIELADEAEDRFVRPRGGSLVSESSSARLDAIATPLRRELFRDISEWEPRSGSWVRKSEQDRSAKKRKVTHSRRLIASQWDSRISARSPKSEHGHMNFRASSDYKPLFPMLLSRAISKRAILHPIQQLPSIPSVSEAQESENTSDDDCQLVSFSDDALDLFAWTSSSPVK